MSSRSRLRRPVDRSGPVSPISAAESSTSARSRASGASRASDRDDPFDLEPDLETPSRSESLDDDYDYEKVRRSLEESASGRHREEVDEDERDRNRSDKEGEEEDKDDRDYDREPNDDDLASPRRDDRAGEDYDEDEKGKNSKDDGDNAEVQLGENTDNDMKDDRDEPSGGLVDESEDLTGAKVSRNRRSSSRDWRQQLVRLLSLYLIPVLLIVPISLVLHLISRLLTPLYNSLPLQLHTPVIYLLWAPIVPLFLIAHHTLSPLFPSPSSTSPTDSDRDATSDITSRTPVGLAIDARTCLTLTAMGGDLVSVYARDIGSACGQVLGPIFGAAAARYLLGAGLVTGLTAFALLCFDHASPLPVSTPTSKHKPTKGATNSHKLSTIDIPLFLGALLRCAVFLAHVWVGERTWARVLAPSAHGNFLATLLVSHAETSILCVSVLLTILTLFLRPSPSPILPFPTPLLRLLPPSLSHLASPTLLVRLPLLILAIRQHLFLRPLPPFTTPSGDLRVLSSTQSLTGRIVVAENLRDGYRFLRCDHSILGGNWVKVDPKGQTQLGDSIFATFPQQEVAVLVDPGPLDLGARRTIEISTGLEIPPDTQDETTTIQRKGNDEPKRTLVLGLGVGIGAVSFSRRGYAVDVIEIDSAVYNAAKMYFHMSTTPPDTVHLVDGAAFIHSAANVSRSLRLRPSPIEEREDGDEAGSEKRKTSSDLKSEMAKEGVEKAQKWNVVVQDCYSAGSVPFELFTKEFWTDVVEVLTYDGLVVVNYAGVLATQSAKMAFTTLLSVFPQCRAFKDVMERDLGPRDLSNLVIICSHRLDPLLTFRRPTAPDVLRSPIRSHVFSTFLRTEVSLSDWAEIGEDGEVDEGMVLRSKKWVGVSEEDGEGKMGEGGENMVGMEEAEGEEDGWGEKEGREVAAAAWRAMQKLLTPEMWKAY